MKPPPFEYLAPSTLDDALSELSKHDGEARPLAGGQSLVPLLNFRLARPAALVDIGRIPALTGVSVGASSIDVGATTPAARLLESDIRAASPVLAAAARLVGHPQIRSRGTVGGSLAHADPAAELPAAALLTGGSVHVAGPRGRRETAADDFFTGLFTTACEWDELVVGVTFPRTDGAGWGFQEFARRPGDFALAGVGTTLTLRSDVITSIVVVAFGVGQRPVRAYGAESALLHTAGDAEALHDSRAALVAEISSGSGSPGASDHQRQVTGVLLERAVEQARRTARDRRDGEA